MYQRLSDFIRHSKPSGYRPGVTLEHVRRNLATLGFEALEAGRGRFTAAAGELSFEVHELPQSQLLMHVVVTEFVVRIPTQGQGEARLDLRHTGTVRRQGIACKRKQGDSDEMARLAACVQADEALLAALMPLDFKRLQLERSDGQWRVRLEHMGASEVVNRMPNFRRYIRLSNEQRDHLLDVFSALQRILSAF